MTNDSQSRSSPAPEASRVSAAVPVVALCDPADELTGALLALQGAVLKHPEATQAMLAALVREGRAFARTERGAATQALLQQSALLRRVWRTWEVTSLWMFDEREDTVLPSGYLDALFCAASQPELEVLLENLIARRESASRSSVPAHASSPQGEHASTGARDAG